MTEITTEQKIIEAAQKIFTQKGFAATRTRDIAEESGINLALINYYFGSKQKLFKIIVEQKFMELFGILEPILSDDNIKIEDKVKLITNNYTNMLMENEDLPIFVLNNIKRDKELLKNAIKQSKLLTMFTLEDQLKAEGYNISILNFIMNIISMSLFPFLSKELFISSGMIDENNYMHFVQERAKQIPQWIMKILESSKDETI